MVAAGGGIAELSSRVAVAVVNGPPPVLAEDEGWARCAFVDPPPQAAVSASAAASAAADGATAKGFTKVAISFDDSDSDEEETKAAPGAAAATAFRVPIDEGSDTEEGSEEEDEEDGVVVPGHRVAIEEGSSSEEENTVEDPPDLDEAGDEAAEAVEAAATDAEAAKDAEAAEEAEVEAVASEWGLEQAKRRGVALFAAAQYAEAQAVFAAALGDLEGASRRAGKVRRRRGGLRRSCFYFFCSRSERVIFHEKKEEENAWETEEKGGGSLSLLPHNVLFPREGPRTLVSCAHPVLFSFPNFILCENTYEPRRTPRSSLRPATCGTRCTTTWLPARSRLNGINIRAIKPTQRMRSRARKHMTALFFSFLSRPFPSFCVRL